ncbi:MAG: GNAT family N-acetyltransferase [Ancalomicrobiaceae bacterium]|nr:GNAT family N-acetyltransferase [Ancalomicrobiaceae bacterium]
MTETLAEPAAAATGFQPAEIRTDAPGLRLVRAAGFDDPELIADFTAIAGAGGLVPLFQLPSWLAGVAEHLVPASGGEVRIFRLVDPATGRADIILPMVIAREGRLTVARLLGDGVCDVLGAIVAPHVAMTPETAETVLRLVSSGLADADILRLTHLAREIDGKPNLLALGRGAFLSADAVYPVDIDPASPTAVSTRSGYKSYQKQWRKLERRDGIAIHWLGGEADIVAGYARMIEMRRARFARLTRADLLREDTSSRFYLAMLLAPADRRVAHLAELVVGGRPSGYLYRIDDGRRFSTVICAIDDTAGNAFAPGLLLFTKLFEKALNEGYVAGDMGVGHLPYKLRFASAECRLLGLERGLSATGRIAVAWSALLRAARAWAKQQPLIARLHARLKGHSPTTPKPAARSEPEGE